MATEQTEHMDAQGPTEQDMARTREVTIYGYLCPLSSQCKEGESWVKTCRTAEDASWYLTNHLRYSSYHKLSKDEADAWLDVCDLQIDTVTEEETSKKFSAKDPSWHLRVMAPGASRHPPYAQPSMTVCTVADMNLRRTSQDRVVLAHGELLACADAIRRAKNAANMAQTLCIKATQSFKEEEKCLEACHAVLMSYVAGAPLSESSSSRHGDEIELSRRRGERSRAADRERDRERSRERRAHTRRR